MSTRVVALAAFAAVFSLVGPRAYAQECTSDADCGEYCVYPPCAAPCDPDDEDCEMPECDGVCVVDEGPVFEECVSDDDCENGWVCEVVGGTACASVVCPDGEACPDPEPCDPEEIFACVPPPPEPCASDSDCDEGLVCVTYTYDECIAVGRPDCPPEMDCPEPPVPDCETVTESYCVPAYFAPCEDDVDCGEGFSCVEGEVCGCSGGGFVGDDAGSSGGSGSGGTGEDAGSGGDDEVPDCFCEPTGELYCELDEMPCESDGDCPEDFVCESLPAPSVPCSYDAETGETFCEEPPGEPEGQCIPEDWESWVGGGPAPSSGESYNDSVGAGVGSDEAQAEGRASDFENPLGGSGNVQPGGTGSAGDDASGCQTAAGGGGIAWAVLLGLALLAVAWPGRRRL